MPNTHICCTSETFSPQRTFFSGWFSLPIYGGHRSRSSAWGTTAAKSWRKVGSFALQYWIIGVATYYWHVSVLLPITVSASPLRTESDPLLELGIQHLIYYRITYNTVSAKFKRSLSAHPTDISPYQVSPRLCSGTFHYTSPNKTRWKPGQQRTMLLCSTYRDHFIFRYLFDTRTSCRCFGSTLIRLKRGFQPYFTLH